MNSINEICVVFFNAIRFCAVKFVFLFLHPTIRFLLLQIRSSFFLCPAIRFLSCRSIFMVSEQAADPASV